MTKFKHSYGQYLTESSLTKFVIDKTLKHVEVINSILEPSFGKGDFIKSLLDIDKNYSIDGYEIDSEIFENVEGSNCILGDYLFTDDNKKYDLIIGNPPYIELSYSFYNNEEKKIFKSKYQKKGRGRINLVHAFFDKSFDQLNDNGIISFLLPSSFLTSPWYNDIRQKIYEDFTIKELVEDVNFKGVSIQVCLLILKKETNKNKPLINKKNNFYEIGRFKTNDKELKTIKDKGFKVGVGHYCWSHYKNDLNNNELGYKLLYSSYINKNQIVEIDNKNQEKKKYLNIGDPKLIPFAIVFPRTSSKEARFTLLKNNNYLFENHIIYITDDDLNELERLYNYLFENQHLIKELLNSTNLTKTEIENIYFDF